MKIRTTTINGQWFVKYTYEEYTIWEKLESWLFAQKFFAHPKDALTTTKLLFLND